MSKTISQEIKEFSVAIEAFDQTRPVESSQNIFKEGFDVVGKFINLDDKASNQEEFEAAVNDGVDKLLDRILQGKPIAKRFAPAIAGFAVDALVDGATNYATRFEEFWDSKVEPELRKWEELIHAIRVAGSGVA